MFYRKHHLPSRKGGRVPAQRPENRFDRVTVPISRILAFSGFRIIGFCAAAALISGCISDSGGKGPESRKGVTVSLRIQTESLAKTAVSSGTAVATAARAVDSARITVSGSGMDSLRFGFGPGNATGTLSLLDIPAGADRRFDVQLFGGGGLLYTGSALTEIRAGQSNTVAVSCLPEFSRLTASIHIPADFPKTVAGGALRVWNGSTVLTAAPTVNGELRNFRLEEVPGDRDYSVSIALWDAAGDTIAKAARSDLRIPKGQNVALVLPLTLAFTQLALTMTVGDPRTTTLVLTLPGGKRTPSAFGEAVFSEVYPIPTTEEGGDNGEWVELFNRVADTLDVSGCQILRDAGTGSGMNFALPANTLIAPGRGLVVGRSAVAFANVTQASALTLTNTSARLELACTYSGAGTVRLDTLRYNTGTSDTVSVRIATAKAASLKPSRLARRTGADAWCLAAAAPAAGEFATTPGGIAGGCGE